jgi:hypothetical protein
VVARDQEEVLSLWRRRSVPHCQRMYRSREVRAWRPSLPWMKRWVRCSEVGVFITVTAAAEPVRLTRTAGTCSASSTHRCRRTSGTIGSRRCRAERRAAAAASGGVHHRDGREPRDEPYGDRVFECIGPFGYLWEISQPISDMPTDEAVASAHDSWYGA